MDRRKIKLLVQASLTDNNLDSKKVQRIADLLTKKELKLYIKALKVWERQHTIVLEVPKGKDIYKNDLEKVYPGKKVIVTENPSLLLGMRVHDNDDIYELSLQNTLEEMTKYVAESYDR